MGLGHEEGLNEETLQIGLLMKMQTSITSSNVQPL